MTPNDDSRTGTRPVDPDRTRTRATNPAVSSSASSSSLDGGRFTPGDIVDARYRVVSLLGRGGMGEVYRAEDLRLGEVVALKFLPSRLAHDAQALERLHGEVRTARKISHLNAVRVHDVGEAEGQPFLTMEYVDGEDLSSLLRRIGALPKDKAVELSRQICAGVAAAHARGIVHRDLKPANVMVDGQGRAKVNDFGLAVLGSAEGERVGTPAYMAPEQRAGAPATTASDVYALGLTLYEMFTGERLLAKELDADADLSLMAQERLEGIDPQIAQAVSGCLAADPSARTPSALFVAQQLPGGDPLAAALAAGETPSPQMVAGAATSGQVPKWQGALLLSAALLGILVTVWTQGRQSIYGFDSPLERPVLEHRARTLLEGTPSEKNRYAYSDFTPSEFAMNNIGETRPATEWKSIASSRPGLHEFTYLSSRQALWSGVPLRISPVASTLNRGAGAATVRLDGRGRLLEFALVPSPELESSGSAGVSAPSPDFLPWFEESGLNADLFSSTVSTQAPPFFAQRRFSWVGSYPSEDALDAEQEVRIDAAANGEQVLWWRLSDNRSIASASGPRDLVWIALALSLLMLGVGGFWAWRHHRSGRGDSRAAALVAMAVGATTLWNVVVGHLSILLTSVGALFSSLAFVALMSLIAWLSYLAIEPYLRRITPRSQVSWNRLLGGQLTDPILGRDFLLGIAAISAFTAAQGVFAGWFNPGGQPLGWLYPHGPETLLGAPRTIANLTHFTNFLVPLGMMFLVVLPRIVLRGERFERLATVLGYGLLIAFSTAWNGPAGDGVIASLVAGLISGLLLAVLAKVGGLVAMLGFSIAAPQLFLIPVSADASLWWARMSWIGPSFLALLAVGSFVLATRGRSQPSLGRQTAHTSVE